MSDRALAASAEVHGLPELPQSADVFDVDDIILPQLTKHLLFVLIDDAPMTRLLNSINAIPDPPAPGPPYTATTSLLPRTPTLDGLAQNGVRLRSLRVQVECSPTRATCLTGVYPFRHGVANVVNLNTSQYGDGVPGTDLGEFGDPGFVFPTIFNTLHDAGIRTAFIGKIHQSADYNTTYNTRTGSGWQILEKIVASDTFTATTLRNLNQTSGDQITTSDVNSGGAGYYRFAFNYTKSNQVDADFLVEGEYNTTRLTNEAIAWWNGLAADDRGFMWLAYNGTHTPFGFKGQSQGGGGYLGGPGQDFPPDSMVSTQEYKDLRDKHNEVDFLHDFWHQQCACMEAIDSDLGRLLASIPPLVRQGLTVVVIGDNGHDAVSLPGSRKLADWDGGLAPNKDWGADWNFLIDGSVAGSEQGNRLKGTVYHYGSGVEGLWSGPGVNTPSIPRKGQIVDFPVDSPDITETICNYFGTSMGSGDGIPFFDALYVDPNITYLNHTRRDQFTTTFNPNGDWHARLATANGTTIELVQAMWSWFLPTDTEQFGVSGRFHLIRKRGAGGVADNTWHYELYQHYDENYGAVDPFEKTNIYGLTGYTDVATEIERRIDALLNSGTGTGDAIEVLQEDGTTVKYIFTADVGGVDKIPVLQEDGVSFKYVDPGTVGSITGMPVDNSDTGSGDKVVPYVSIGSQSDWALRVDISTLGPFDKVIPMDANVNLPVFNSDTGAGDKVILSTPGSPPSILVENSDAGSGDKVLLLEAFTP